MKPEFMLRAIELAKSSKGDVPVGAVIIKNGEIMAEAFNEREKNNDASAHAEIIAIRKAGEKLKNWRLQDCEIYVTLEPCPMCASAIIQSRISKVYFGAFDIVNGAFSSKSDMRLIMNSSVEVKGGLMEEENAKILKEYFERVR